MRAPPSAFFTAVRAKLAAAIMVQLLAAEEVACCDQTGPETDSQYR